MAGSSTALFTQEQSPGANGAGEGSASAALTGGQINAQTDQSLIFLDEDETGAEQLQSPKSTVFVIIRMVLVLALVAGAVYGVLVFIRRLSRPSAAVDPHLKVLSSVHLGSNRYVHVVLLGQKAYLLGASDGGVSLITGIDDKETIDAMLLDDSRKRAAVGIIDFRRILRGMSGVNAGMETALPSPDFVKKRRERFKGV